MYFFYCNLLFSINIICFVRRVAVVHLFSLLYSITLSECTTIYPFPIDGHLGFSCVADSVSASPLTLESFLVLSAISRCCRLHLCLRTFLPTPCRKLCGQCTVQQVRHTHGSSSQPMSLENWDVNPSDNSSPHSLPMR